MRAGRQTSMLAEMVRSPTPPRDALVFLAAAVAVWVTGAWLAPNGWWHRWA
ncbi:MAG: hypothetical protein HKN82_19735, partial [Akkermansiaceae bacterium]|nr:hypothetical protein [Akkermansiaceae bacterium]